MLACTPENCQVALTVFLVEILASLFSTYGTLSWTINNLKNFLCHICSRTIFKMYTALEACLLCAPGAVCFFKYDSGAHLTWKILQDYQ